MQSPEAIQIEIDQAKSKINQDHLANDNEFMTAATSSSNSCETIKPKEQRLLVAEENIFGFSLLLIDENSFILNALTQSKDENFLLASKNKSAFPEAFLELEVELITGKRAHLLVIRARSENGDSHHNDIITWIKTQKMSNYLTKLGIIRLLDSKEYAVTGEAELKILKKELEKNEPVNLGDLNVKFNSKGTISDKYKPFRQITHLKSLDSEQMIEKIGEYNRKKNQSEIAPCPVLKTYILKENWHLDEQWDIDVKLDSPTRRRSYLRQSIPTAVDSKPEQSRERQGLTIITGSGYGLYQSNSNKNKINITQIKESKDTIEESNLGSTL